MNFSGDEISSTLNSLMLIVFKMYNLFKGSGEDQNFSPRGSAYFSNCGRMRLSAVDSFPSFSQASAHSLTWGNPGYNIGCSESVSYTHLTLPTNREV